jgi:hypothetical protein
LGAASTVMGAASKFLLFFGFTQLTKMGTGDGFVFVETTPHFCFLVCHPKCVVFIELEIHTIFYFCDWFYFFFHII